MLMINFHWRFSSDSDFVVVFRRTFHFDLFAFFKSLTRLTNSEKSIVETMINVSEIRRLVEAREQFKNSAPDLRNIGFRESRHSTHLSDIDSDPLRNKSSLLANGTSEFRFL